MRLATVVGASDNYVIYASVPGAPVYRLICGDVWFHIDGASGAMVQRLDQSGRAYRWLFNALHIMDIPALVSRPKLRSAVIVTLSSFGLIFSLTGVVIGWRRLSVYYHQACRWSSGRPPHEITSTPHAPKLGKGDSC